MMSIVSQPENSVAASQRFLSTLTKVRVFDIDVKIYNFTIIGVNPKTGVDSIVSSVNV